MTEQRACQDCAACCFWPAIPGFKHSHTSCTFLVGGQHRCGIYDDPKKPAVCGTYRCMWLDGHFTKSDRPNRIGVCFSAGKPFHGYSTVIAHEIELGASQRGRAAALIAKLSFGLLVVVQPADASAARVEFRDPAVARTALKNLSQITIA